MIKHSLAAIAALAGTAAVAATPTPQEIVQRHMDAAGARNIDALVADYADDAVVLQAGQAAQGKPAIRAMFDRMFPKPAAAGAAAPPSAIAGMKVDRVWQEGDVGFVTWTMGPVKGTDEFLVRNGKILVQTVFISGAPPAASAK